MKEFVSQYKNPNEKKLNMDVIKNYRETSLLEYIVDICKNIEVTGYIKFDGYEYITDESKFDLTIVNKKHQKRRKGKKYSDKNMDISVGRYDKLILKFIIDFNGETRKVSNWILLPKRHKNCYYMINGNKFYPIYQLVDSSTYNSRDKITLKTLLMPTVIQRKIGSFKLVNDDKEIDIPYYIFKLFKKESPILLYYLATFGLSKTIKYFGFKGVISIVDHVKDDLDDYYYIKCSSNLYIKCIKFFFDADSFTASMCAMLKMVMTGRKLTLKSIDGVGIWLVKLGACFTTTATNQKDKGKNVLLSFRRIIDDTTKKHLKLKDRNKKDMYSLVRWMLRNFQDIKLKDNLDLKNKRLRMTEYIAGYFSTKISNISYRLLNRTKLLSADYIESCLQMKPTEIINKLVKSPLLRYDDTVNDMDFFNALKYSSKGPSSLGEGGSGSISIRYRGIHPSHVGRLDLNTCSSSDPGLTGIISPFVETYDMFFDPEDEPQFWVHNFKQLKKKYMEGLTKQQMEDIIAAIKKRERDKRKVFRRINKDNSLIDDISSIICADEDSLEYVRLFNIENKKAIEEIKINRKVFKRIDKKEN